jgi:nitroreductase
LWERGGRDATKPEVDTYGWRDVDAWATGAFAQAPVMIVVCGDSRKMDASRLPSSIFPAVQNILLAAIDLGLGSLLSTLPVVSADDARAILALPDHLVPLALIPIGWPARTLRPPTRHSFAEKTHRDRYGTPWK